MAHPVIALVTIYTDNCWKDGRCICANFQRLVNGALSSSEFQGSLPTNEKLPTVSVLTTNTSIKMVNLQEWQVQTEKFLHPFQKN